MFYLKHKEIHLHLFMIVLLSVITLEEQEVVITQHLVKTILPISGTILMIAHVLQLIYQELYHLVHTIYFTG